MDKAELMTSKRCPKSNSLTALKYDCLQADNRLTTLVRVPTVLPKINSRTFQDPKSIFIPRLCHNPQQRVNIKTNSSYLLYTTVASIVQCLSLSHIVKRNVLSLYEQITRTRGARMGMFLHLCLHCCVRIPANSRTFQDLKLKFPGLSRTKIIIQDFRGLEILQKNSRTFQEALEP